MAQRGPGGKFMSDKPAGEDTAPGVNGTDGVEKIPPEDGPAPDTAPPGKRGRGRPPGAKTGDGPKRRAAGKSDPAAMARQIQGAHALGATFLGIPELLISEAEARLLADGMAAMADEFGLSLGGKAGAIMLMLGNAGMVYGPRVFAIAVRMSKQQAPGAQGPVNGNIYTTDFKRE